MDAYTDMLVQVIKDPMGVLESIGQSISDTVEEEGIMYVTGYGASAFVPIVGQARAASVVRVGRSALNQKVRDIVRNHKAFEGFKTKPVEFVRNAMNEVAGGIRALQHQLNHGLVPAMSGVPNTPINTLSTRALMNTADETLSRVVGKGTGKPLQKHHYATNKSKKYTPQIEAITKKYGLDLDDVWNIELLPHQGRHPNAYHEYVLSNIRTFDKIAKGDKRKFLRLFEQLKQEIRKNPEMLYKDYWRKK